MLLAGTDTTAVAIEWAVSSLLNHPEILKKAKDEIDNMVGQDRLVDESDIPKLPYLQNIIYETLRLFAPAPLLLPHYSSEECTIGGFTIPRDTIVLINAWSIHRDPKVWIQCFEWKRPTDEEIDMRENKGLALPKLIPLEAMFKTRPISEKVMQQLAIFGT